MPHALHAEKNLVSPALLRLDRTTAYIRGDSDYYKPFPGPEWFTPSRMAEIHKRLCRIRACMVAMVQRADTDTATEIERYYLHLLSNYQFSAFGGEIGPDESRLSAWHKATRKPRSLSDWHRLLDFLSDRMFYWSKQRHVNVAQIEGMIRIWLLIRYSHKNRNESGSIHHAHNMRNSRSNSTGREPSARRCNRRSLRSSGRSPAV